jgi:hypothetical protein
MLCETDRMQFETLSINRLKLEAYAAWLRRIQAQR